MRIEHFISVNLIDTREIKAFERLGVTFEIPTGPLASFEIGESDPLWPSVAALLREFGMRSRVTPKADSEEQGTSERCKC